MSCRKSIFLILFGWLGLYLSSCAGINVKGQLLYPNRKTCKLDGYWKKKFIKTKHEIKCIIEGMSYKKEAILLKEASSLACQCGADAVVYGISGLGSGRVTQSKEKIVVFAVSYQEPSPKPQGLKLSTMYKVLECRDSGGIWRDNNCI